MPGMFQVFYRKSRFDSRETVARPPMESELWVLGQDKKGLSGMPKKIFADFCLRAETEKWCVVNCDEADLVFVL